MWKEALACGLLTALALAFHWPDAVLPYHDSLLKYQFFHFAYSHVIATGEIPMWIPYGGYGFAAALHQLTTLTPTNYFVGAFGAWLGAGNTLSLFKLSFFLEVALYVAGLWLFARSAYEHALSRVVVVVGGVCSLSWLYQPYFNFHAFYLFPYLLLFLFAFLRSGDPGKLWLAASVGAVSMIGGALYLAPLQVFVLTILGVVAVGAGARPPLCRGWRNWLLRWEAGVAVALAAIIAAAGWLGVQDTVTVAEGRNPDSYRVPLGEFLEYGRRTVLTTVNGYLSGNVTHADNTYYVGLLPVALVVPALLWLRHPLFLGAAAAWVALIWLSFGGYFSMLAYYFPMMWLYRHIGLTFGIGGLLLIIAAGWVVDGLAEGAGARRQAEAGSPRFRRLVVLAIAVLIFADLVASWREHDWEIYPSNHDELLFLVPFRIGAYIAASAAVYARWRRSGRTGNGSSRLWAPLIAAYLLDVGSYQAAVLVTLPRAQSAIPGNAFAPDMTPYRPFRMDAVPADPLAPWKLALLGGRTSFIGTGYGNTAVYAFTYTFLGVDPCSPVLRNTVWQRGVYDALVARGGRPGLQPGNKLLPRDDPAFRASLGCNAPKMVLVGQPVVADTAMKARELLQSVPDPGRTPVLETPSVEGRTRASPEARGHARVVTFNANRLEIDVMNGSGQSAWLYYADAFHRDWKARVNEAAVPVIRVNVGFKAVQVPPGRHPVVLTFGDGKRRLVSWLLALVGCAACITGLVAVAGAILRRHRTVPAP